MDLDVSVHGLDHHVGIGDEAYRLRWGCDGCIDLTVRGECRMPLSGDAQTDEVRRQSGIFSIIFAMCLRGLGCKTRMGAVVLTMATSGGAVIPVIMDPVNGSRGIRYGFSVAVAVFAFGLLLPLYTTVVPAARVQVDPVYQQSGGGHSYGRPLTPKKFGRALAGMVSQRRGSSDSPTHEHMEKRSEEAPG